MFGRIWSRMKELSKRKNASWTHGLYHHDSHESDDCEVVHVVKKAKITMIDLTFPAAENDKPTKPEMIDLTLCVPSSRHGEPPLIDLSGNSEGQEEIDLEEIELVDVELVERNGGEMSPQLVCGMESEESYVFHQPEFQTGKLVSSVDCHGVIEEDEESIGADITTCLDMTSDEKDDGSENEYDLWSPLSAQESSPVRNEYEQPDEQVKDLEIMPSSSEFSLDVTKTRESEELNDIADKDPVLVIEESMILVDDHEINEVEDIPEAISTLAVCSSCSTAVPPENHGMHSKLDSRCKWDSQEAIDDFRNRFLAYKAAQGKLYEEKRRNILEEKERKEAKKNEYLNDSNRRVTRKSAKKCKVSLSEPSSKSAFQDVLKKKSDRKERQEGPIKDTISKGMDKMPLPIGKTLFEDVEKRKSDKGKKGKGSLKNTGGIDLSVGRVGEDEWEVECLIDWAPSTKKPGRLIYKIKWLGWPEPFNSWYLSHKVPDESKETFFRELRSSVKSSNEPFIFDSQLGESEADYIAGHYFLID